MDRDSSRWIGILDDGSGFSLTDRGVDAMDRDVDAISLYNPGVLTLAGHLFSAIPDGWPVSTAPSSIRV